MKKQSFALVLIMALLLSACQPRKDVTSNRTITTYNRETDDQPFWNGSKSAVSTKYGYYFMINEKLYLYDAKSNKITPLCGRADCTHGNTSCNAVFEGGFDYLGYYNDNLYTVLIEENRKINLYQISADGSQRVKLCQLGLYDENENHQGITLMAATHRGYFYYSIIPSEMVPTKRKTSVYRVSLTDDKHGKEEIYCKEGFGSWVRGFYAYNNTVLFSSALLKEENKAGAIYEFDNQQYSYYDISNNKVVDNIVEGNDENTDTLFVGGDDIYYCKEGNLCRYSMTDGKSEEVVEGFFGDVLPSISYDFYDLYCMDDETGVITVYDATDFSKKKEIETRQHWNMLFGDDKFLFAVDQEESRLMVYDKKHDSTWRGVDF